MQHKALLDYLMVSVEHIKDDKQCVAKLFLNKVKQGTLNIRTIVLMTMSFYKESI